MGVCSVGTRKAFYRTPHAAAADDDDGGTFLDDPLRGYAFWIVVMIRTGEDMECWQSSITLPKTVARKRWHR